MFNSFQWCHNKKESSNLQMRPMSDPYRQEWQTALFIITSFSNRTIIYPCPVEFQSSVACSLGNEMLIEAKWAIFKEKLYDPVWNSPCLSFFFARRQAELPKGTVRWERLTKWGHYEQSHSWLMWTLVWEIRHLLLRATATLEPLHIL